MTTLYDASEPSLPFDLYARRARTITQKYIKKIRVDGPASDTIPILPASIAETPKDPVGILGAGPGGLYTAMILDDLGIPYKILEAQDRVGGRLFTYEFADKTGAPYNYFDVGAMRFPKIESMRRVFNLFESKQLNSDDIALKAKLRPFHFVGAGNNNTFLSYNNVTVKQSAVPKKDPFKPEEVILGVSNPTPYITAGVKAIVEDVIDPFVIPLLEDLKTGKDEGWKHLMEFDMHSTRSYMSTVYLPSDELVKKFGVPKQHLPTDVINWLETFDKSSAWYDRSLAETVLESIAFGYVPKSMNPRPTQWFCIDGGSNQIAKCMETYIKSRQPDAIAFKSYVTAISIGQDGRSMDVVTDDTNHHRFSHVISTIPLPVLRTLDLSGSELSPMQANALRQLDYGPSVKIGLQFKTAWWTTGVDKDGKPLNIVGGQTYTDRIVRTIVYPSFGNVQAGQTTTLTASYCWTEDSARLAALIDKDKARLIKIVLRDLAVIHNVTVDFLEKELIDSMAWSWSLDQYTMGAFAFFGPGKFENVYRSLTSPAGKSRLHFAGEAISSRHAWVEGAFDSAWRAVNEMLWFDYRDLREDFYKRWGVNPEWVSGASAKASVPVLGQDQDSDGPHNHRGGSGPGELIAPTPEDDLVLQQMRYVCPDYL